LIWLMVTNKISFNLSLRQGFVPSLWKSTNVSPVPRSTPAQDIDSDFRPISITAIVSKILESFPCRWLFQSIIGQIDPLQFGALRGSSMALVHLLHRWYAMTLVHHHGSSC
jgi:hypothetical protein